MNTGGFDCGLLLSESQRQVSGFKLEDLNNSTCANSDVSCSFTCKDNLRQAKEAIGCCVNSFNSSSFARTLPFIVHDVWESCGVESPGECMSKLSLGGATPIEERTSVWMIIRMVLISLNITFLGVSF